MATRRERVILDLEDHFTAGIARAAAGTALLNKELNSLSRDSVRTRSSVSDIDRPMQTVGRSAANSSKEVDKMSGRMRIFADVAAILGPGLVGIGAVGIPVVTTLAAQFGFAATAAGTTILAFQGVGDTLKALNKAALEPTAQNMNAAELALERLSPAAQGFVAELGKMLPELRGLRDIAAQGMFPGLTAGLSSLETGLPHVRGLIAAVSEEIGHIGVQTGASLASDKWTSFLDFLAQSAPRALGDMARAAGSTAHALAALWMATDPVNNDFSGWIVEMTQKLDEWATGLSKTQGFADFVAYLDKTGPKVAETFGALANAVLQIVEAAAPLSGPVLDGVTAVADAVSAIADSDLGTPIFTAVAALSLFNRTLALTKAAGGTTFGGFLIGQAKASLGLKQMIVDLAILRREASIVTLPSKGFIGPLTEAQVALGRLRDPKTGLGATFKSIGKSAALLGGVGIAATGAADGIGLTNTASLALAGTMAGPWGTAIGGSVGLLLDAKAASKGFADSMNEANLSVKTFDVTRISASIAELQKQSRDLRSTTGIGDFFGDLSTQAMHPKSFLLGGDHNLIAQTEQKITELKVKLDMSKEVAAQDILRRGFYATKTGIDQATQSATAFQRSLEKLNDTLTGRSTQRDYQQAVDDFEARAKKRADLRAQIAAKQGDVTAAQADIVSAKTPSERQAAQGRLDSAKESIKSLRQELELYANTLDISTQAGRDNQAALDNIAASALKVAQGLSGAERTTFLAAARDQFVKAAEAAKLTTDQAQALADKVLGLKGVKGSPKIVIDATGAWRVIDAVAARLERLTRKTHTINIRAQAGALVPQVLDAQAHAGGGTVRGSRYPYGDKVLALLAPTEEVITNRNGEADRYRADRAAGRIPAYGNGGTVHPPATSMGASGPVAVRMSDHDIDRIAGALLSARSIYGPVTVHGDGSFERHAREQRTRSLSGQR